MMTVRVNLSPERILKRRGLGPGGGAQNYLAQAARRRMDKYVPYDTGALRRSARVARTGAYITYSTPYAARQFYENYRHADPARGDHWHARMLRREGRALVKELAEYQRRAAR